MTDRQAPRRATIELLLRGADEESFELREIGSNLAFALSRPRRLPPESYELAEVASRVSRQRGFILKSITADKYLYLSEQERFLWDRMDGRTSLQDIATAYVLEYGEFDFVIIRNLVRQLQRAQLLTLRPMSRLRQALERNRRRFGVKALERTLLGLERVNVSSARVHRLFERLHRWGGFLLFTRAAAVACAALAVAGLAAGVQLWRDASEVVSGFGAHPVLALLSVKLLFLLSVGAHQVVHGLACVHYRRRVREFGFTFLHGIVPTFYIDVTDIFMTSRRARVVTAISGPLLHLVLGSVWFIVAAHSPHGFLQAFAAASGLIQWQSFAVSLYPFCFLEMDGYHVFIDVLEMPRLKQDALAYVGKIFRGIVPRPLSRKEGFWIGYVALSVVSVAAFVAFNVWVVVHSS